MTQTRLNEPPEIFVKRCRQLLAVKRPKQLYVAESAYALDLIEAAEAKFERIRKLLSGLGRGVSVGQLDEIRSLLGVEN